jgi:hypothetical protein
MLIPNLENCSVGALLHHMLLQCCGALQHPMMPMLLHCPETRVISEYLLGLYLSKENLLTKK